MGVQAAYCHGKKVNPPGHTGSTLPAHSRQQERYILYCNEEKNRRRGVAVGKIVGRVFISLGLVLLIALSLVYTLAYSVANGPSTTMRNTLVNMAMQASATKWVPGLVLKQSEVDAILADAKRQNVEIIQDDTESGIQRVRIDDEGQHIEPITKPDDPNVRPDSDIDWSQAVDGIYFKVINAPHCRAYVAIIKDPTRVYTATSSDFKSGKAGIRFWDLAERDNTALMINAGEYPDNGGGGNGSIPMGITYSRGACVWDDGRSRTFMGFDKDNRLVLREGLTRAQADALGIRDGVCFQYNNILIQKKGDQVVANRRGDTAVSQRTAIGQREDGAVIFLVTDGRTGASPGASYNDVIDIMLRFGAVNAGMLDGGSSSLLYYRDYYNIYNYDISKLDKYQKMGLVNVYKAFTEPRRIPTYFAVGGAS